MRPAGALALVAGGALVFAAPWRTEPPTSARETGRFADARLAESSGVIASRRAPGLLWSFGDGGTGPLLFATDTLGRALATYTVTGAQNKDWEALARGPCGERARERDTTCLYLADTGDNDARRPSVTIYRFPEPADPRAHGGAPRNASAGATDRATAPAQALGVRYPDGAHDVEAAVVTPAGDLLLLAKTFKASPTYYRVPARAWDAPSSAAAPVRAELVDTLPIAPDALGRWVTDAALAPDGRHVVVRTYRDLYLFRLDAAGRLLPADPPARCDIFGLEPQGEGVDWLDARTLVLTSERALGLPASIHLVRCPSFTLTRSPTSR